MVNSLVNHQAAAGTNGCQLCKPVVPVCLGLALDVRPGGRRSPGYTAPRATFAAAAGSRLDLRWHPRTGRPASRGLCARGSSGGRRLLLAEPVPGCEGLAEPVIPQGLADLDGQLGLARPQYRPRAQPGPPTQALSRPGQPRSAFGVTPASASWANAARQRVT